MGRWNALKHRPAPANLPKLERWLANRLYGERTAEFHQPYLDGVARDYRAPIQLVDFRGGAATARSTMNDWVMQQTFGRIADLVPEGGVDGCPMAAADLSDHGNAASPRPNAAVACSERAGNGVHPGHTHDSRLR